MSVSIEITRDTARPALKALERALTPRSLGKAVGVACMDLVKRNFIGLGTNKRGWPSTNFWARAAKATSWSHHPEGAMINVNQVGVRQRWLGGVIRPVSARALTIPMSPVAYGHRASEFAGSFILKGKDGAAYIVQKSEERDSGMTKSLHKTYLKSQGGNWKARTAGRLEFLFKLMGSVTQASDARVLPSHEELGREAREAIVVGLKRGLE